jgi:hypothetical protein
LTARTVLALAVAAMAGATAMAPDPAALERENRILERRLELASGDSFYLLLDVSRSTLRLMLRGAEMSRHRVGALEVGAPRTLFVPRGTAEGWQGRIWTGGELDPARERERLEIVAVPGTDPSEAEAVVPPTPEEIYQVPSRFLIRFREGLALELVPQGSGGGGLRGWWGGLLAAFRPVPKDAIRLRIELDRAAFESLYRSLPPQVGFLALPPHIRR